MLGAIYTGLSGMDAYSKGLKTISDNVANLNTAGFKSSTVSFNDLFSVGGGGLTFSDNHSDKSGAGVAIGDPMIDFSQGDLRQTDNDLDLSIQGSGFLVLQNDGKTYYTRTGQFEVDKDGYISEKDTGYHLMVLDDAGHPTALNIDAKRTSAPTATTKISFADNLSSSATSASVSDIAVYDDRGGKHVWKVNFTKDTTGGVSDDWTVTVVDSDGTTLATDTLKFTGSIVDPTTATLVVTDTPPGAGPMSVTLDFSSGVTSFSAGTGATDSTLRAASVDGNGVGALTTVTVDENGKVKLTYSNEKTELEGAIAIADFRDPQELERVGDGLYRNSGAGEMRMLASGVDGIGTLKSKQIEASNVDLSQEFGDLILIQRGFQACSQVVSVTNDMIQQLFGIRGQG
jgi:flagellar hook protein FlgE